MDVKYFEVYEGLHVSYDVLTGTSNDVYVLLPSLGDIRQEYRYLAPLLHQDGLNTVYSVDLRGMGESDVQFSSYTPLDSGKDVATIIELIIKKDLHSKFILVGNEIVFNFSAMKSSKNYLYDNILF